MRVIGYVRLSSTDQVENGPSLAAQEEKIRTCCEIEGWEVVEVVSYEGYRSGDLKRPALDSLVNEVCRKGRCFDGMVATKLNRRLTRSVRDLVRLTRLADHHSVTLVFIREGIDTSTATGRIFRNIVTTLGEWQRGVIGERTREGNFSKGAGSGVAVMIGRYGGRSGRARGGVEGIRNRECA